LWAVLVLVLACTVVSLQAGDAGKPASPQTGQLAQREQQAEQVQREHLVILHINDTHGQLEPHKVKGRSVGGIARVAGLVKQIRRKNPGRVLVVHAGDVFSGGDAVTNHYKGRANIDLMNRMDYDAMVLGNGEYYWGLENLRRRTSEAEFTILAGNIFEVRKDKPKAVGKSFVVKKVGPLRVGLMGLSLISPKHPGSRNLRTAKNLELARKWLGELEAKTDLIVLLSHLGLADDTMAAGMLSGVKLIVGGHTHTVLNNPVIVKRGSTKEKVYIVQAGKHYEYLGRIDLGFSREKDGGWKVTKVRCRLIPVSESIKVDGKIAKRLEEYHRQMKEVPTVKQMAPAGVSP